MQNPQIPTKTHKNVNKLSTATHILVSSSLAGYPRELYHCKDVSFWVFLNALFPPQHACASWENNGKRETHCRSRNQEYIGGCDMQNWRVDVAPVDEYF
ncbi:unnamed protein product [Phyllotreta striolata]|uniref:Uncharacterized protein n=1 Tax=Phyllotreta striolata TaxID=444603 RepID=A0A9N9TQW5_PHYSR|nr:unnamed protein product [Phyllotreta striolata]